MRPSRKFTYLYQLNSNIMENESLLKSYGIRPTAIRLMILKCIMEFESAFSYDDIADKLETVDRSTIFRTLSIFDAAGLIHKFEDGIGNSRYCILICDHVHVSCRKCGRTFCIPIKNYPQLTLPENFEAEEINYTITGLCRECNN